MTIKTTLPRLRQAGVSLIELMVGMTIGLLILVVLSALVVNNTQARTELDETMQQVENGRYGVQLLLSEVRLAGYYGSGDTVGSVPALLPDPCKDATAVSDLKAALPVAIQGYSQKAASPLTCLSASNFLPGTDVMVVRRAQTEPVLAASLVGTIPYLQTMGDQYKFDVGSNPGSFSLLDNSGNPAPIYPYSVQIYFVSPCDKPAGGGTTCTGAGDDKGKPVPTLKRMELTETGWVTVSLVQGIEMMHVEYGIDTDKDGVADSFVNEPTTASEWANVMVAKVYLLARNPHQVYNGYKNAKSYQLGSLLVAAKNDSFKRHAYAETIRLVNVSSRRDQ